MTNYSIQDFLSGHANALFMESPTKFAAHLADFYTLLIHVLTSRSSLTPRETVALQVTHLLALGDRPFSEVQKSIHDSLIKPAYKDWVYLESVVRQVGVFKEAVGVFGVGKWSLREGTLVDGWFSWYTQAERGIVEGKWGEAQVEGSGYSFVTSGEFLSIVFTTLESINDGLVNAAVYQLIKVASRMCLGFVGAVQRQRALVQVLVKVYGEGPIAGLGIIAGQERAVRDDYKQKARQRKQALVASFQAAQQSFNERNPSEFTVSEKPCIICKQDCSTGGVLALVSPTRHGAVVTSCGHELHFDCFAAFSGGGLYECPLCKTLGNTLVPRVDSEYTFTFVQLLKNICADHSLDCDIVQVLCRSLSLNRQSSQLLQCLVSVVRTVAVCKEYSDPFCSAVARIVFTDIIHPSNNPIPLPPVLQKYYDQATSSTKSTNSLKRKRTNSSFIRKLNTLSRSLYNTLITVDEDDDQESVQSLVTLPECVSELQQMLASFVMCLDCGKRLAKNAITQHANEFSCFNPGAGVARVCFCIQLDVLLWLVRTVWPLCSCILTNMGKLVAVFCI